MGAVALRPTDLMIKVSGYKPVNLKRLEDEWQRRTLSYKPAEFINNSFIADISDIGELTFARKFKNLDGTLGMSLDKLPLHVAKADRKVLGDYYEIRDFFNNHMASNPAVYWNNPVGGKDGWRQNRYTRDFGMGKWIPEEGLQFADKRAIAPRHQELMAAADSIYSGKLVLNPSSAPVISAELNRQRQVQIPSFNIETMGGRVVSPGDWKKLLGW